MNTRIEWIISRIECKQRAMRFALQSKMNNCFSINSMFPNSVSRYIRPTVQCVCRFPMDHEKCSTFFFVFLVFVFNFIFSRPISRHNKIAFFYRWAVLIGEFYDRFYIVLQTLHFVRGQAHILLVSLCFRLHKNMEIIRKQQIAQKSKNKSTRGKRETKKNYAMKHWFQSLESPAFC